MSTGHKGSMKLDTQSLISETNLSERSIELLLTIENNETKHLKNTHTQKSS